MRLEEFDVGVSFDQFVNVGLASPMYDDMTEYLAIPADESYSLVLFGQVSPCLIICHHICHMVMSVWIHCLKDILDI